MKFPERLIQKEIFMVLLAYQPICMMAGWWGVWCVQNEPAHHLFLVRCSWAYQFSNCFLCHQLNCNKL